MENVVNIVQWLQQNFGGIAILGMALSLVFLIYHAHHSNAVNWADLITSKGTKHVSLTKCLQLLGGVTGTWIIVYITLHNKLTYDLLLVYLTYIGGSEAFSKYISAKHQPLPPTKCD